ncbi:unnamed protein product [Bursaphelenchus xylophilus]|uniref:Major sperm protein n=1 Tax=Bursaphelenchus xylophilus TaxID=6326 RepID=A0A1I7SLQ9_BURXY|nr:unnamed protein product [Bursaphelenchus xylophilus]CAG9129706.1 unnamed protein product [Bursaphelenchus xylophilus]
MNNVGTGDKADVLFVGDHGSDLLLQLGFGSNKNGHHVLERYVISIYSNFKAFERGGNGGAAHLLRCDRCGVVDSFTDPRLSLQVRLRLVRLRMPDFELKLEPTDKIVFAGKKLGEEPSNVTLKITNPKADRIAYKVKCTSNEMFRIRPPVGALKANESTTISLVFNAGKAVPDSGKHYFAVYYIKAADEKKLARSAWSEHKGDPEGTKRLYVEFKKDGAAEDEKKEDKKEDDKKEDKKEEKKEKEKEKEEEKKEEKKEEEKKEDDKKEEKKEDEKKEDDKKEEEKKE